MNIIIAHASLSENGTVNGQAGDQTGKEVCKRTWYNKPWSHVIRFADAELANRVADCMENAADNDCIGYSQDKRNTLLNVCRKYAYDVSKVSEKVNCDCSSLVAVACMYAGVPEKYLYSAGNCVTTRTIKEALKKNEDVYIYTTSDYTKSQDKLRRGDILLSEGHHVAVVVGLEQEAPKPIKLKDADPDIVKKVLDGKMGNGTERKNIVMKAGYDPDKVQRKVNEVITYGESLYRIKKSLGNYWELALSQIK